MHTTKLDLDIRKMQIWQKNLKIKAMILRFIVRKNTSRHVEDSEIRWQIVHAEVIRVQPLVDEV